MEQEEHEHFGDLAGLDLDFGGRLDVRLGFRNVRRPKRIIHQWSCPASPGVPKIRTR